MNITNEADFLLLPSWRCPEKQKKTHRHSSCILLTSAAKMNKKDWSFLSFSCCFCYIFVHRRKNPKCWTKMFMTNVSSCKSVSGVNTVCGESVSAACVGADMTFVGGGGGGGVVFVCMHVPKVCGCKLAECMCVGRKGRGSMVLSDAWLWQVSDGWGRGERRRRGGGVTDSQRAHAPSTDRGRLAVTSGKQLIHQRQNSCLSCTSCSTHY